MTTTVPAKPNAFEPMDKVRVKWTSAVAGAQPVEYVGTVVGFGQELKTYRVALPFGIAAVYAEADMKKA